MTPADSTWPPDADELDLSAAGMRMLDDLVAVLGHAIRVRDQHAERIDGFEAEKAALKADYDRVTRRLAAVHRRTAGEVVELRQRVRELEGTVRVQREQISALAAQNNEGGCEE